MFPSSASENFCRPALSGLAMRRCVALLLCLLATPAHAQDAGVDAHVETVAEFESHDPFERDPADDDLGRPIDPMSVVDDDDPVLSTTAPTEDELLEPPVRVVHGAVIDAIAGVREVERHTEIRLGHGLALVEERIVLESSARHRAEALLRIAVPADARLVSLSVCNDAGCRDGLTEARASGEGAYDDALVLRGAAPSPLPVGHAAIATDAVGPHVALRVAPVVRTGRLRVSVRWVSATPVHGGSIRWSVPGRGPDPRIAPRRVTLVADDVVEPTLSGEPIDGEREVDGGQPFAIEALLPRTLRSDRLEALVARCGAGWCVRARALGPRPTIAPQQLVVAIDASPSTTIGARGRIADTLRVLLGVLPAGSRVRVVAFAARVLPVTDGAVAPDAVVMTQVRTASSAPLGASTRFEALFHELVPRALDGAAVVVIGDGGITSSPGSFAAWADVRDAGVRVSSVNVADRPTTLALAAAVEGTGGLSLDVGAEAAMASEGDGDAALAARLLAMLAGRGRAVHLEDGRDATSVGALRDGEDLVFEGPVTRAAVRLRAGETNERGREAEPAWRDAVQARLEGRARLVAVAPGDIDVASGACADDGARRSRPATSTSAVLGPGRARVALAHRRSCTLPAAAPVVRERSLPSRPLLAQLRRRVIPAARRCFRDDRRGRADYSTRADIRITLADRELVETRVEGPITDALSSCLAAAFDGLDIPGFDGTVLVHWPLYTAAEPPPPTLELAPDVSRAVDRLLVAGEPTEVVTRP